MKIPLDILLQLKGVKQIKEDQKEEFDELIKKPDDQFTAILPTLIMKDYVLNSTESQIIGDLLDRIDTLLANKIGIIKNLNMQEQQLSNDDEKKAVEVGVIKVLESTKFLLKKEGYRIMFRSLDQILELFYNSDNYEILNLALIISYRIFSDKNIKYFEFEYLGTENLARLFYSLIFFIQHQNCFNGNKIQMAALFKDDEQYQKYVEAKSGCQRRKKTSIDIIYRPEGSGNGCTGGAMIDEQQQQHYNILEAKGFSFDYQHPSQASLNYTQQSNSASTIQVTGVRQFSVQIKDLFSLAQTKQDSGSSSLSFTELTKKIIQQENLQMIKPNTPIYDALLFRVRQALKQNSYQTRILIASCCLNAFAVFMNLIQSYQSNKQPMPIPSSAHDSVLSYKQIIQELFDLFYLKLIPSIHSNVLFLVTNICKLEQHPATEELKSIQASHTSFIQRIFMDFASLQLSHATSTTGMAVEEMDLKCEKGVLLAESTLKDLKFQKIVILQLIDKGTEISSEGISAIMKIFESPIVDNHLTYNLKILDSVGQFLQVLIKLEDRARDHNMVDRILQKGEQVLGFALKNEKMIQQMDKSRRWVVVEYRMFLQYIADLIQIINQIFKRDDNSQRRTSRQMVPTIARKIADSQLLALGSQLIEVNQKQQQEKQEQEEAQALIINLATLVQNICGEVPQLIQKFVQTRLIQNILQVIFDRPLPTDIKQITQIINFLNYVSMNEQGAHQCSRLALVEKIFKIFLDKEAIKSLSQNKHAHQLSNAVIKYITNIDSAKDIVIKEIMRTLNKLLQMKDVFQKRLERYIRGGSQKLVSDEEENKASPNCPFTVQEHLTFCKMLQNFIRFFNRMVLCEHPVIKKILQVIKPDMLLGLIQFPLLQMVDTKESKQLMQGLQHICKQYYDEFSFNKVSLLLEDEFKKLEALLEGPLSSFEDFSKKLPDEICYQTRVQEITEMIEKRDPAMLEPINIMGKLLLIEGLIDCYRYAGINEHTYFAKEPNEKQKHISNQMIQLYRIIVNQIHREEAFFLKKTLQSYSSAEEKVRQRRQPLQKEEEEAHNLDQVLVETEEIKELKEKCKEAYSTAVDITASDYSKFLNESIKKFFKRISFPNQHRNIPTDYYVDLAKLMNEVLSSVHLNPKDFTALFLFPQVLINNNNKDDAQLLVDISDPENPEKLFKQMQILTHTSVNLQHVCELSSLFLEESKKLPYQMQFWPCSIMLTLYEQGGFASFYTFLNNFFLIYQQMSAQFEVMEQQQEQNKFNQETLLLHEMLRHSLDSLADNAGQLIKNLMLNVIEVIYPVIVLEKQEQQSQEYAQAILMDQLKRLCNVIVQISENQEQLLLQASQGQQQLKSQQQQQKNKFPLHEFAGSCFKRSSFQNLLKVVLDKLLDTSKANLSNLLIKSSNQKQIQHQQHIRRMMMQSYHGYGMNQEEEVQDNNNIQQQYEDIINQITQMGFQRRQAEAAMEAIMIPDVSMLVDWIANNPNAGQDNIGAQGGPISPMHNAFSHNFSNPLEYFVQQGLGRTNRQNFYTRGGTQQTSANQQQSQQQINEAERKLRLEKWEKNLPKKIEEKDFEKNFLNQIMDLGKILVREVFWLEGFEKAEADLLLIIINKREQEQMLSDYSFILFAAIKKIVNSLFHKFNFKVPIKGTEEVRKGIKDGTVLRMPPLRLYSNHQLIGLLNSLIPLLLKLGEKSLQVHKNNSFMRQDFGLELLRLSQLVILNADNLLQNKEPLLSLVVQDAATGSSHVGQGSAISSKQGAREQQQQQSSGKPLLSTDKHQPSSEKRQIQIKSPKVVLPSKSSPQVQQQPQQLITPEQLKQNFENLEKLLLKIIVGLYYIPSTKMKKEPVQDEQQQASTVQDAGKQQQPTHKLQKQVISEVKPPSANEEAKSSSSPSQLQQQQQQTSDKAEEGKSQQQQQQQPQSKKKSTKKRNKRRGRAHRSQEKGEAALASVSSKKVKRNRDRSSPSEQQKPPQQQLLQQPTDIIDYKKECLRFIINLLQTNNQLFSNYQQNLISNNILQGLLTLLIQVCNQNEENIVFFLENHGFQYLFAMQDFGEKSEGILDLFYKLVENCIKDEILEKVCIEAQIKHFFFTESCQQELQQQQQPLAQNEIPQILQAETMAEKDKAQQKNKAAQSVPPQQPLIWDPSVGLKRRDEYKVGQIKFLDHFAKTYKDSPMFKQVFDQICVIQKVPPPPQQQQPQQQLQQQDQQQLQPTQQQPKPEQEQLQEVEKELSNQNKTLKQGKKENDKDKGSVQAEENFVCLKPMIQLHRFDCAPAAYFQQDQEIPAQASKIARNVESNQLQSIKKKPILQQQQTTNQNNTIKTMRSQSEDRHTIRKKEEHHQVAQNQMINFHPKKSGMAILHLIMDAFIRQFNAAVLHQDSTTDNQLSSQETICFKTELKKKQQNLIFHYALLIKVLHLVIRKYPVLISSIMRVRYPKAAILRQLEELKQQQSNENTLEIEKTLKKLLNISDSPTSSTSNSSLSFLGFLMKTVVYFSINQFQHILFEICLEHPLLCENHKHQTLTYAHEMRRKILHVIYETLEKELEEKKNDVLNVGESTHALMCYSSLHTYLLQLREVARLSLRSEDFPHGWAFMKLYADIFKQAELRSYFFQQEKFLPLISESVSILHQYQIYFLVSQKLQLKEDGTTKPSGANANNNAGQPSLLGNNACQEGINPLTDEINRQLMPQKSLTKDKFSAEWNSLLSITKQGKSNSGNARHNRQQRNALERTTLQRIYERHGRLEAVFNESDEEDEGEDSAAWDNEQEDVGEQFEEDGGANENDEENEEEDVDIEGDEGDQEQDSNQMHDQYQDQEGNDSELQIGQLDSSQIEDILSSDDSELSEMLGTQEERNRDFIESQMNDQSDYDDDDEGIIDDNDDGCDDDDDLMDDDDEDDNNIFDSNDMMNAEEAMDGEDDDEYIEDSSNQIIEEDSANVQSQTNQEDDQSQSQSQSQNQQDIPQQQIIEVEYQSSGEEDSDIDDDDDVPNDQNIYIVVDTNASRPSNNAEIGLVAAQNSKTIITFDKLNRPSEMNTIIRKVNQQIKEIVASLPFQQQQKSLAVNEQPPISNSEAMQAENQPEELLIEQIKMPQQQAVNGKEAQHLEYTVAKRIQEIYNFVSKKEENVYQAPTDKWRQMNYAQPSEGKKSSILPQNQRSGVRANAFIEEQDNFSHIFYDFHELFQHRTSINNLLEQPLYFHANRLQHQLQMNANDDVNNANNSGAGAGTLRRRIQLVADQVGAGQEAAENAAARIVNDPFHSYRDNMLDENEDYFQYRLRPLQWRHHLLSYGLDRDRDRAGSNNVLLPNTYNNNNNNQNVQNLRNQFLSLIAPQPQIQAPQQQQQVPQPISTLPPLQQDQPLLLQPPQRPPIFAEEFVNQDSGSNIDQHAQIFQDQIIFNNDQQRMEMEQEEGAQQEYQLESNDIFVNQQVQSNNQQEQQIQYQDIHIEPPQQQQQPLQQQQQQQPQQQSANIAIEEEQKAPVQSVQPPQQQQQTESQVNQNRELVQRQMGILQTFNLDESFFERYQIDLTYFDALPEEDKFDIIQAYLPIEEQRIQHQRMEQQRVTQQQQQQRQQPQAQQQPPSQQQTSQPQVAQSLLGNQPSRQANRQTSQQNPLSSSSQSQQPSFSAESLTNQLVQILGNISNQQQPASRAPQQQQAQFIPQQQLPPQQLPQQPQNQHQQQQAAQVNIQNLQNLQQIISQLPTELSRIIVQGSAHQQAQGQPIQPQQLQQQQQLPPQQQPVLPNQPVQHSPQHQPQTNPPSTAAQQQQQHSPQQQQLINIEIPMQSQQQHQASRQGDIDNVTFLESLTQELREEVLMTSENEFLDTLPPEIRQEAQMLRERRQFNDHYMDWGIERNHPRLFQQLSHHQQALQQHQAQLQALQQNQKQSKLYKDAKEIILKDKCLLSKLYQTDERLIESLLKLLYLEQSVFIKFPFQLLKAITVNPTSEFKILDAMMFILNNQNLPQLKGQLALTTGQQQLESASDFPFVILFERNNTQSNYKLVYQQVSLKILFILSQLSCSSNLQMFLEAQQHSSLDSKKDGGQIQEEVSQQQLQKQSKDKSKGKSICKHTNSLASIALIKQKGSVGQQQQSDQLTNNNKIQLQSTVYLDLIHLLMNESFFESQLHLHLIVHTIFNITKKYFNLHMKQGAGDDNSQQQQDNNFIFKFQLDSSSIKCICQVLSSDHLHKQSIKELSEIINHLCFDKNNLDLFIAELREIIMLFAENLNVELGQSINQIYQLRKNEIEHSQGQSENLQQQQKQQTNLKINQQPSDKLNNTSEQEFNIIREIEQYLGSENNIYKIFLIIRQLFEKSYTKSVEQEQDAPKNTAAKDQKQGQQQTATTQESANQQQQQQSSTQQPQQQPQPVEQQPNNQQTQQQQQQQAPAVNTQPQKEQAPQQIDVLEKIKAEIRNSFQSLINDKLLKLMYLNVTELFALLLERNNINFIQLIIQRLTPILECFFIIYQLMHDDDTEFLLKKKNKKQQDKTKKKQISSLIRVETLQEMGLGNSSFADAKKMDLDNTQLFMFICEKAKTVINMMIKQRLKESQNQGRRQYTSILKEPLGIVFKKIPRIIEFENKKQFFRQEHKLIKQNIINYGMRLRVSRKNVFQESYNYISKANPNELKGRFTIEFIGEEGYDAGGLLREWYTILSKEIFNANYALFKSSLNGNTFLPNAKSSINPDHLQYFKFIGRIVGKALYDGQLLDAFFTRSFYKHILGQPLTYHDMEDQDIQLYKNLKWIVENEIKDLGLTWSYEEEQFGKINIKELCNDGKNIPVTEENKLEYVQTYCYSKMAEEIKPQIEAFLEGFHDLIPPYLVSIFDSHELELMISGLPDIDIQDLKENTEYHGYQKDSAIIVWFWEIMENFDNSQKANFLQFVTGTSKVPLDGFKNLKGIHGNQKFQIHKAYDTKKLPTAHTCFNQIDIPEYPTKEILIEKLVVAIMEGKEGFGFI